MPHLAPVSLSSSGPLPGAARPQAPRWSLPEKYQVRRVIGTGAMGTVLLARDANLRRLVAVKVLSTDCSDFLARLRSEARLLARLDHPSIVRVHELDKSGGRLFLAMEYVAGGNLALADLAPEPLVHSLRGAVDALAHAHAHGVVHRDVKPENILLDRSQRPGGAPARTVLTDFGLAISPAPGPRGNGSDEARAAGTSPVVGTPLTMSPEQARGDRVGPASDAFSLGATLYRKLTGVWPFRGRTVVEVLDAIQNRRPEPLRAHGRDLPRRLDATVMRMLEKDPAERLGSMEEIGAELGRAFRSSFLLSLPRALTRAARRGARGTAARVADGPSIHPEDFS